MGVARDRRNGESGEKYRVLKKFWEKSHRNLAPVAKDTDDVPEFAVFNIEHGSGIRKLRIGGSSFVSSQNAVPERAERGKVLRIAGALHWYEEKALPGGSMKVTTIEGSSRSRRSSQCAFRRERDFAPPGLKSIISW